MVMVSHKYQFIFVKTRKTAGTSIEMALEALCRPPGAEIVEATPAVVSKVGIVGRRLVPPPRFMRLTPWRKNWLNHMSASKIRDALGRTKWDRYQKITSVRNPFDLTVSRFHWQLTHRGNSTPKDFAETRAQFNAMVQMQDFDYDYSVVHIEGKFVAGHVIRFENLRGDLEAVISAVAPGQGPLVIPHAKNTGMRRTHSVAEYYDQDSIATVLKKAAWVFGNFDYPETPAEIRPQPKEASA